MTNRYKTQCPHCHTVYPMPDGKLNKPKARANCGKCGQTFLLNDNLIDEHGKPVNRSPAEPNAKQAQAKPASIAVHATHATAQAQPNTQNKTQPSKAPPSKAQPNSTATMSQSAPPNRQAMPKPDRSASLSIDLQDDKDYSTYNAPHKKTKTVKEGMIFDGMDMDKDIQFDDSELNAFLSQDLPEAEPVVAAGKKGNKLADIAVKDDDESWLDELLKNDDSPNIAVVPASSAPASTITPTPKAAPTFTHRQAPEDDEEIISRLIGEDLDKIIPVANNQDDPESVRQKINARLHMTDENPKKNFSAMFSGVQLLWLVGSVLLIIIAGVQYVVFNQDAIIKNPAQAQLLRQACVVCQMPSADTKAFAISHQFAEESGRTSLSGVIKNSSGNEQLYPNLRIQVLGQAGLLGDLVIQPKDYLAFNSRSLGANQEERFLLALDTDATQITSVTVEPFY